MSSLFGNQGMRGPTSGGMGQRLSSGGFKDKVPSGYKSATLQQFTPEQLQLFQSLFSQVSPDSFTAGLANGDEGAFDQMEAPAMRQFQGLQGQLASRFSGMGSGARRSSGFQNTMNQASSDFAQDLQSRRVGLQRQAIQDLMGMSTSLLGQRPYERFLAQKPEQSSSGWGGLAGSALGGLGGFFAGGPSGALSGAKLGYNVGSGF